MPNPITLTPSFSIAFFTYLSFRLSVFVSTSLPLTSSFFVYVIVEVYLYGNNVDVTVFYYVVLKVYLYGNAFDAIVICLRFIGGLTAR